MKVKNTTTTTMRDALKLVNKCYDGNIVFKTLESVGRQLSFTLTVNDSGGKGARHSTYPNAKGNYRRIAAACWHVHGYFFEALLELNPNAVIRSSGPDGPIVIDVDGGNWQDRNIGSMMQPMLYSEACYCK